MSDEVNGTAGAVGTDTGEAAVTSGTAVLLAAAPAGRGRAMDAVSVLPALAAVPPGVLTGTATATLVELADPIDPQTVLTRLRAAAQSPGPLVVYLAGQLHLDRRQQLPHLALARSTTAALRYTAFPWHWLAEAAAAGPTTVVADLVADPEAWTRLGTGQDLLHLNPSPTLYARVAPPPRRGERATPDYLRAWADQWRAGTRAPFSVLHTEAAARTQSPQSLFLPAAGHQAQAGEWGRGAGPGAVPDRTAAPATGPAPAPAPTAVPAAASAPAPVAAPAPARVPNPVPASAPEAGPVPVPDAAAAPLVPGTGPVRAPAAEAFRVPGPADVPVPAGPPAPTPLPSLPEGYTAAPPAPAPAVAEGPVATVAPPAEPEDRTEPAPVPVPLAQAEPVGGDPASEAGPAAVAAGETTAEGDVVPTPVAAAPTSTSTSTFKPRVGPAAAAKDEPEAELASGSPSEAGAVAVSPSAASAAPEGGGSAPDITPGAGPVSGSGGEPEPEPGAAPVPASGGEPQPGVGAAPSSPSAASAAPEGGDSAPDITPGAGPVSGSGGEPGPGAAPVPASGGEPQPGVGAVAVSPSSASAAPEGGDSAPDITPGAGPVSGSGGEPGPGAAPVPASGGDPEPEAAPVPASGGEPQPGAAPVPPSVPAPAPAPSVADEGEGARGTMKLVPSGGRGQTAGAVSGRGIPPMPAAPPVVPAGVVDPRRAGYGQAEPVPHDPHPAILSAAMAGRHAEAAEMAAAWERDALRRFGPRSAEAVHWMEVRADLARLAGEPARSCELWLAVAEARLGLRQQPDDRDVEGAVDRAHHQWEQITDPARARALGPTLLALRRRVPGRRPGALEALRRRMHTR
ncbi:MULTISPECIES: hypothetical protein [unclassified Streptomyces]|uniref:hypothetical protein n=1 Tax=unclassified Streptomyces TaxID=2593676 RepID=UPI001F103820|nr:MULTISPECIES: hypothetical protein [unclassified Streptomyces]